MLHVGEFASVDQHVQLELALARLDHPTHEATFGHRQRGHFSGQGVQSQCVEHGSFPELRPQQRQHGQLGGGRRHIRPEHHLAQVIQQRLAPPRLGVEVGDAAELGLKPVVFDPALPVQAEVLRAGAVGEFADVLRRDAVQPALPVGTGQGEHTAMRAIDQHRAGFGCALFAQRVAVMPDDAGVGPGFGGGNSGHTPTLRASDH